MFGVFVKMGRSRNSFMYFFIGKIWPNIEYLTQKIFTCNIDDKTHSLKCE